MFKVSHVALVLSALSLAACSKSADQVAEALTSIPGPSVPAKPAPHGPSVEKWTGPGTMQMTGAPDQACASVTAEISQDDKSFDLQKFTYDCSGTSSNTDPIRLDLRAGDLYLGADKVGTKLDNKVAFAIHDPSGATISFEFVTANDVLQAKETLSANGFQQVVSANLKK
jgi:hypothetical protein